MPLEDDRALFAPRPLARPAQVRTPPRLRDAVAVEHQLEALRFAARYVSAIVMTIKVLSSADGCNEGDMPRALTWTFATDQQHVETWIPE